MPIFDHTASNVMLSVKILLLSTTVLSLATVLKLSAPAITDAAVSLPSFWNGVVSWLKPPYLYLVINCIIITIVATSKLQSKFEHVSPSPPSSSYVNVQPFVAPKHTVYNNDVVVRSAQPLTSSPPAPEIFTYDDNNLMKHSNNNGQIPRSAQPLTSSLLSPEIFTYSDNYNFEVEKKVNSFDLYDRVDDRVPVTEASFKVNSATAMEEAGAEEEMEMKRSNEFVISNSSYTPASKVPAGKEYSVGSAEKPPASARFAHHRKTVKASPEGGKAALGVSKPRRQDTLETTWKTITEGRAMPLTRHLKKSDTWEMHGRHHKEAAPQKMTKCETFPERSEPPSLSRSSGSGKLKKEPSLGQDELNRRVEAFIRKFNEDMRLQRQESLNQFMEMINRGAH